MLQIYKAKSFIRQIEVGARTKPWVVLVRTPNGLRPYVVKLFETPYIKVWDSVTNEVIGNVLASQFNLNVPSAAFIDFDHSFVQTLPENLIRILNLKDDRLKFGTELLEGVSQFNIHSFSSVEAREVLDIDTLFGFDNLIRNADRTPQPANLLVGDLKAFLIDHEMAFDMRGNVQNELETWEWPERFWKPHIFHGYLKRSWSSFKQEYFNEFEEYLKLLNVQVLNPYFMQLSANGFSSANHDPVINYLSAMKKNSNKFVNVLKAKIL
ncbi:MAG: HipA family kinase [Bacteroidota bacterium]